MIVTLLLCVYLDPEKDFSLRFLFRDAPSHSLQDPCHDALSSSCDVVLDR